MSKVWKIRIPAKALDVPEIALCDPSPGAETLMVLSEIEVGMPVYNKQHERVGIITEIDWSADDPSYQTLTLALNTDSPPDNL